MICMCVRVVTPPPSFSHSHCYRSWPENMPMAQPIINAAVLFGDAPPTVAGIKVLMRQMMTYKRFAGTPTKVTRSENSAKRANCFQASCLDKRKFLAPPNCRRSTRQISSMPPTLRKKKNSRWFSLFVILSSFI